jgi:methyl-accepting chemotaxis protein
MLDSIERNRTQDASRQGDSARSQGVSVRTKLLFVITLLGAALLIVCSVTIINSERQKKLLALARQQTLSVVSDVIPLQRAIREIQVDVIQVQQFLTDASATHDPAAFAESERHSRHFYDEAKNAQALLSRLEAQDGAAALAPVRRQLEVTIEAFKGYAQHGETMAHLYIDRGLDLGNEFMKVFDTTAEYLYVQLDGALDILRKHGETKSEVAVAAIRRIEESDGQAIWLAAALAVLGAIVGGLAFQVGGTLRTERHPVR